MTIWQAATDPVSVKVKRFFNDEPGVPAQTTTDRVRMLMLDTGGLAVLSQSQFTRTINWGSVTLAPAPRIEVAQNLPPDDQAEQKRLTEERAKAEAEATAALPIEPPPLPKPPRPPENRKQPAEPKSRVRRKARKAEEARQAEIKRQQEIAAAETARKAEEARQAEEARKAEEARVARREAFGRRARQGRTAAPSADQRDRVAKQKRVKPKLPAKKPKKRARLPARPKSSVNRKSTRRR